MLRSEFLALISARSAAAVGRELGVTRQAVHRWIKGHAPPPKTVILLAELLWRAPRDLPAGLPGDGQDHEG